MSNEGAPPGDFLTTYLAWCAGGTAPVCFHRWAGLSLLSASIQTRVQTARDDHRTSTLALYVMLVGESGTGKGEAITRRALEVIGERHPAINPFAGQISSAALLAYMAGKFKGAAGVGPPARTWGHCWYVAEELASDVRMGEAARTALADLTALWGKRYHAGMTVSRGYIVIPDLCLNVLIGTTETWLRKVFPPDAVESGTLARFLTVTAPHGEISATTPTTRLDPDATRALTTDVRDWITAYSHVATYQPPIVLQWDDNAWAEKAAAVTEAAQAYHETHFRPHMARTDELVSKLAGLAAVSGWGFTREPHGPGYVPTLSVPAEPHVTVYAVRRAIGWYKETLRGLPRVIKVLRSTAWTLEIENILAILRDAHGSMPYGRLIREAFGIYGMTAYNVKKAVTALEASEEIATSPANTYLHQPMLVWARDDHDEVDP